MLLHDGTISACRSYGNQTIKKHLIERERCKNILIKKKVQSKILSTTKKLMQIHEKDTIGTIRYFL